MVLPATKMVARFRTEQRADWVVCFGTRLNSGLYVIASVQWRMHSFMWSKMEGACVVYLPQPFRSFLTYFYVHLHLSQNDHKRSSQDV